MRTLSAFAEAAPDDSVVEPLTGDNFISSFDTLAMQARDTIRDQARTIAELAERIDRSFGRAVGLLHATPGHTVVTGIGKSGIIARKMAATLASTGTPSFFVHPAEALHGDLGMITDRDTLVVISYSGETEEVVRLLPHLQRLGTPIIALVGRLESTLGRAADVALDVSVEREACPNNLAPTNSTLAAMALADALSVALMRAREFGVDDFARLHPGGALGRRLHLRVKDVMHGGDLPIVAPTQTVRESLFTITRGRLGLALVHDGTTLRGIVTDGDLRRAMQRHDDVLNVPVAEIMSAHPITIAQDALFSDAEKLMRRRKIKALVVLDDASKVVGIVEIFQR
jgi:arabinose-5-phosphate isomerase